MLTAAGDGAGAGATAAGVCIGVANSAGTTGDGNYAGSGAGVTGGSAGHQPCAGGWFSSWRRCFSIHLEIPVVLPRISLMVIEVHASLSTGW